MKFGIFVQNRRKCRYFPDFLYFRGFLLRYQEPGEKCKKLPTTGVQTPWRPLHRHRWLATIALVQDRPESAFPAAFRKRALFWRFPCATGSWDKWSFVGRGLRAEVCATSSSTIPLDGSRYCVHNFRQFLQARRTALAEVVGAFLEKVKDG